MQFWFPYIALFFGITHQALANPPKNCKSLNNSEAALVIKTKDKPKVILIHNSSETDLWLNHPTKGDGAKAGWTSRIEPGKWSALVVDKKRFSLTCIESRPGHEQEISCAGMISACQLTKVRIPEKFTGTFWAIENVEQASALAHLGESGFKW